MRKLLAIMLTFIMFISFAGCKRGTDFEEIKKSGKIIVGITDYEPMNYKVKGEWTGFDSEFASLFAKELGVEVEFKEIVWKERYDELKNYNIDCIWNAMSVMQRYQTDISVSNPYILNSQVLVMRSDDADKYTDAYDIRRLKFVGEEGSSGADRLRYEGYDAFYVKTQYEALKAVADGKADGAIIDSVLADFLVGNGKEFESLAKSFTYSDESCAVGFRKGSDLTEKFNEFMSKIKDDELIELANKYGLTLC